MTAQRLTWYRICRRQGTELLVAAPVAALLAMSPAAMATQTASDAAEPLCPLHLEAWFVESAPRDRFEFINRSRNGWSVARVELDLANSAGQLVFDTEDGGVGVEVFQPYRAETSSARVADATLPEDGGQRLSVVFERFGVDDTFAFTIDVDDRLTESDLGQIRVSGSEIQGARLSVVFIAEDLHEEPRNYRYDSSGTLVGSC